MIMMIIIIMIDLGVIPSPYGRGAQSSHSHLSLQQRPDPADPRQTNERPKLAPVTDPPVGTPA